MVVRSGLGYLLNRREVLLAAAAGALNAYLPAGAGDDAPAAIREPRVDLAELSLAEASRQILRGTITSRELTLACLERIAAENPRVNACITVMREEALAQAAVLDAEARQNRFRSPLHGIPIALKDAIDTAGTCMVLQWCADYLEDPAHGTATAKLARYIEARATIERLRRMLDAAFNGFDVLVMPTLKGSPPTIEVAQRFENGRNLEDLPLVSIDNTLVFNRLGLPALTVPCGFSPEGWPIGVMIGGPRFSEGRLLALGAAYERSTEWHKRRPARGA